MRRFSLIVILACLSVTPVNAQNCLHTGTLTGVVLDPTGAVIRGASIESVDSDGRIERALSGRDGRWELACLAAGSYRIQISSPGFQSFRTAPTQVRSDGPTSLTTRLQVESVTEELNVDGGLDPAQPGGGNVLSSKQLDGLAEDPDDLQRQLQALAAASGGMPGSALITVDG